jgi:hypothetical protein
VTVDLDSLLGRPGSLGGEAGGPAPLAPEACRRLACDGAVTRVLVTRHPSPHHHPSHQPHHRNGAPSAEAQDPIDDPDAHDQQPLTHHPNQSQGLKGRLQAATALLPPVLGGAPTVPLEVGRTSRVVTAGHRSALAVRDGGCVFPDCSRPLAWCEAHHLRHWLHGGPTDLANLALLCRTHHRAVHEGGWRLARQPDGRLTATPPHRFHRRDPAHFHRRQPGQPDRVERPASIPGP